MPSAPGILQGAAAGIGAARHGAARAGYRVGQLRAPSGASQKWRKKRESKMRLTSVILSGCISAAFAAFAAPVPVVTVQECAPDQTTVLSRTGNFKAEANTIFRDMRSDARQALDRADDLEGMVTAHLSWQSEAVPLSGVRVEVNDMAQQVCRLEGIRGMVTPWQQAEINRVAATTRLLADNTDDAITFLNDHQNELWSPTYQKYTRNIYDESRTLERSLHRAVKRYGGVHQEMKAGG